MTARDQHPLSVERFGPVRQLQRERWIPVPPHIHGLCLQGPSVLLVEDAAILAAHAAMLKRRAVDGAAA